MSGGLVSRNFAAPSALKFPWFRGVIDTENHMREGGNTLLKFDNFMAARGGTLFVNVQVSPCREDSSEILTIFKRTSGNGERQMEVLCIRLTRFTV